MTDKFPAPAPPEVPKCFGDRFLPEDPTCEECPVQAECAPSSLAWTEHRSLAEQLAAIEVALDEEPDDEPVETTYARLFQEFFGRKPRHGQSPQHAKGFDAVRALPSEIDRATYIAGKMWAMHDFAAKSRYGFLPIMLSGEKAMRRYAAYIGSMGRRYRHGKHTAKNTHTERGRIRRALFEAEHEIADWFVNGYLSGTPDSWKKCVAYVRPNATWRGLHGVKAHIAEYHRACSTFGTRAVRNEVEYATLRAAVAIANGHQHRLADRIGVRAFSWEQLAELLVRTLPIAEAKPRPDLSDVPGVVWGW